MTRHINSILFKGIIVFIYLKLIFSYLTVKHGWWQRHIPTNAERYNFLGVNPELSNILDFFIIPFSILFLFNNLKALRRFSFTLVFGVLMLILNLFTFALNDVSIIDSVNFTFKVISPILVFMVLVIHFDNDEQGLKRVMIKLMSLCIFLAIIALLFFNSSVNRQEDQLPIYFSGIHTHSYVLASVFIGYSYLFYLKSQYIYLLFFITGTTILLLFGYGVRSAALLYFAYIASLLFVKSDSFKVLLINLLLISPIIISAIFFFINTSNLNTFSSGRIDMYTKKLEIISDYNFIEMLFGRGSGSDQIKTKTWWWHSKGSHSDYLTFIVENGWLYFSSFFMLIFSLFKKAKKINIIFAGIILGYFLTSLISNGVAVRPTAGYVFFIVLAFVYKKSMTKKQLIK